MRISINNVLSDALINTVLLYPNLSSPSNVYFFRCYKCGTGLNQIQGSISAIYAGYFPSDSVATINRCPTCRENYTYQTIKDKPHPTKLILSSGKTISTFHCMICRHQLLQYNNLGAALLPEFKAMAYPNPFSCFNPVCKVEYLLKDIVEAVMI